MQVVLLFLKQDFQLLHEETTHQFIFPFLEAVQLTHFQLFGHFPDNGRIYAGHIHLDFRYLIYILHEEVHALIYQQIYFEEIG